MGLGDLNTDVFLEVQDKKYASILYLIKYIVYGLHLWYKIYFFFKELSREPIPLYPGLGSSLDLLPNIDNILPNIDYL